MTARTSFMAETLDRYGAASRVSSVLAALGFSAFVWFVAAYTGVRPRPVLWAITAAFAAYGVAAVFLPDLVVNTASGVDTVTFPWGETVYMVQTEAAALLPLLLLATLAMIVYSVVADIQQFRKGDRDAAVALAIGIAWFVFTIIEESLVQLGVFDFVVLTDFGFLGFVVAMSLQMVNSAIATESELVDYRDNLEAMVAERSAELETAQAQLLAQAEEQATRSRTNPTRSRAARCRHPVVVLHQPRCGQPPAALASRSRDGRTEHRRAATPYARGAWPRCGPCFASCVRTPSPRPTLRL